MMLQVYRLSAYPTLTGALQVALGSGQRRKPWIIASLNGFRYYLFRSSADLGQQLYTVAAQKVALNMAIERLPANHNVQRTRAHALDTRLDPQVLTGLVDRRALGGHAEEYLIDNWRRCVYDYKALSVAPLRTVDLFMSHSPCVPTDRSPSQQRFLGDRSYEVSCMTKLQYFAKANHAVTWRCWYREPFGRAEGLDEADITRASGWLNLHRMRPDILSLCTALTT